MHEAKGAWAQPTEESGFEAQSTTKLQSRHPSALRAKDAFHMREAKGAWAQPTEESGAVAQSTAKLQSRHPSALRAKDAFHTREAKGAWAQPTSAYKVVVSVAEGLFVLKEVVVAVLAPE